MTAEVAERPSLLRRAVKPVVMLVVASPGDSCTASTLPKVSGSAAASWATPIDDSMTAAAASASDEIRRSNAMPANYRARCRSTVCSISADFPNRGAVQDWLTLFSTGVGGELPNEAYIVTDNQDGSVHLDIMGLARK